MQLNGACNITYTLRSHKDPCIQLSWLVSLLLYKCPLLNLQSVYKRHFNKPIKNELFVTCDCEKKWFQFCNTQGAYGKGKTEENFVANKETFFLKRQKKQKKKRKKKKTEKPCTMKLTACRSACDRWVKSKDLICGSHRLLLRIVDT